MFRTTLATCAIVLSLGATSSFAVVPNTINYQGRLTDATGAVVPDGTILVKFTIYDAAVAGTVLWNSGFQQVTTADGYFSYALGSNVILPDLFGADSVRYLGITVNIDPEMSPRSQFTSSGYVFKSLRSDSSSYSTNAGHALTSGLAEDAQAFAGETPAFYVDWGNMTNAPAGFADGIDDTTTALEWTAVANVPAGFADGIDNVGIGQGAADSRYILETGDTLTGSFSVLGSTNIGTASNISPLTLRSKGNWSGTVGNGWGDFSIGNGTIGLSMGVALNGGGAGDARIWTKGGAQNISMGSAESGDILTVRGGVTGNNSISMPNNAISNAEIFDEPGIAQNQSSVAVPLLISTMSDLVTVTINIPTSGYIVLSGRVTVAFWQTTGRNWAEVQIDETAGGLTLGMATSRVGLGDYASSATNAFDCSVQRTYFKSAGTYTFRIEAQHAPSSTGQAEVWYSILTAMYFPTSYGSVTTLAPSNPGDNPTAKAVSVTNSDGTVTTGYEMDLSYYEEMARAAEIAKQKAELDVLRAQTALERARQSGKIE